MELRKNDLPYLQEHLRQKWSQRLEPLKPWNIWNLAFLVSNIRTNQPLECIEPLNH